MVDLNELRYLALSFPDTTEDEYHDRPSFRVNGKIFATLPDDEHINIMLDPEAAHIATIISPAGCAELWGGERLTGITVTLAEAELDMLAAALTAAWRRKAPSDLAKTLDQSS